jgi:hypothetical protein
VFYNADVVRRTVSSPVDLVARHPRTGMISAEQIRRALRSAWAAETSYDPQGWSTQNPAWGQCAVSALIVQDFFGGALRRARVNGHEHYWNYIDGHGDVDVTREQFGEASVEEDRSDVSREFVLSFPATQIRYERLKDSVLERLP